MALHLNNLETSLTKEASSPKRERLTPPPLNSEGMGMGVGTPICLDMTTIVMQVHVCTCIRFTRYQKKAN